MSGLGAIVTAVDVARASKEAGWIVGQLYVDGKGRTFKYVQTLVAATVGEMVGHTDGVLGFDTWKVTPTFANSTALKAQGVVQAAALAINEYGFVQCQGLGAVDIVTSGAIAADITFKFGADGAVVDDATPAGAHCGFSMAAASGNVIVAGSYELRNMI